MGFFSKIKDNFGHGVKVHLDSPRSLKTTGDSIETFITVSNTGKKSRTINSLTIKFYEIKNEQRDATPVNSKRTIAKAEVSGPFSLEIGEVKKFNHTLSVSNPTANLNPNVKKAVNVAGALLNNPNTDYYVRASADVEGIALDPSDSNRISF